MNPKYSIVVPVFNEEEVITVTHERLSKLMRSTGESYELVFINDGSRDKTPELLAGICAADKNARLINFSRNFGHQPAITAGMDYAQGDAVVVIDADLQDPPEVILDMIKEWKNGYDVVYGKRLKRRGETFFKKFTANAYYRFLKSMTSVDIPVDTGDFRLIDRKVCDAMKALPEKSRYVRGLVSWVGFRQKAVEYVREERFAGETKYPLKKMIKLAMDGIAAFSYKPLKLASFLGTLVCVLSALGLLTMLGLWVFGGPSAAGWLPAVAGVMFLQGVTLITLGIAGEYLGRVFEEMKGRPIYIVRETLGFDK